jgi:hypothetical protein
MFFPCAMAALLAELPASAFDGTAVAGGAASAGSGEDDPAAGRFAAEAVDVPPKLVT